MSNIICSPLEGKLVELSKVPDEAFSQNMMGEGCAIIPVQGKVYAPFDGVVEVLPETKHALGLTSSDGIELLIHIGLETVELNGKYFTVHVKEGDSFTTGDILLDFDIEKIESEGYNIISPITVTDMGHFSILELHEKIQNNEHVIQIGESLMIIKQ